MTNSAVSNPPQSTSRRYAGKSSEQRSSERRERLLSVALEEFSSTGFRNTRIEVLCRRSSVTTRYFYQLFGSREALLEALYDSITGDISNKVRTAVNQAGDSPEARSKAGLQVLVAELFGDPRRARIVFLESAGVSEELDAHHRCRTMSFVNLLEKNTLSLVKHGDLKPTNHHPLALALVGASLHIMQTWVSENQENEQDYRLLTAQLTELFTVMRTGISAHYGLHG